MKDGTKGVLVILVLAIFTFMIVGPHFSTQELTITVKKQEVVMSDGDSKYLIFTEQGEVFANNDTLLRWKFDSSDMQSQLDKGKTFKVKVYGWRIPFLSKYRNISVVREEVTPPDK
jgi:hypothetical protein